MYSDWFTGFASSLDDSLAAYHDVLAIKVSHGDQAIEQKIVAGSELPNCIETGASGNMVRGLFTRHNLLLKDGQEVSPWQMSLRKDVYKLVERAYEVSPSYLYTRVNANASGSHTKTTRYDESGKLTSINLVLRIPHSPQNEEKSIWSVTLSWNATLNSTAILFDGMTHRDQKEFTSYFATYRDEFKHPFSFLVFLTELLNVYYTKLEQSFSKELWLLEKELGITWGSGGFKGWKWELDEVRKYTQSCYRLAVAPVYTERRLVFLISLSHFLLEALEALPDEAAAVFAQEHSLGDTNHSLMQNVRNTLQLAESQLHQNHCLDKRLYNLTSTLNTIVAQMDSRSNLDVAKAAKHDSSSMLTIAFLTAVFLPPTFVCSFFSMSLFDFSRDGAAASMVVSPLFWMYWAVAVPLTAVVLLAWKLWESRRKLRLRGSS